MTSKKSERLLTGGKDADREESSDPERPSAEEAAYAWKEFSQQWPEPRSRERIRR